MAASGVCVPGARKIFTSRGVFIRSRDGWSALERKALAMEAVAGLAGTTWKQDESTQVLALVEEVLDYLAHHPLEGVDEPIRIYLTCYEVLRGYEDDRAGGVLGVKKKNWKIAL